MKVAYSVLTLGMALGFLFYSLFSVPESKDQAPPPSIVPNRTLSPPASGETVSVLALAYDPYDDCVGKWQHVWPRKTPGGGEPEKMGLGADPDIFPYGTRIKFSDPKICKFIQDTDPKNTACVLTVDDTGTAATESTKKGIYHLELRVPRRTPHENAHHRARLFGRHADTEAKIIYSPGSR